MIVPGQRHDKHVHVTKFVLFLRNKTDTQGEHVLHICPNIVGASGVSISCKYLIG